MGLSLNQEIISDEVAPGVLRTPDYSFYPFDHSIYI